MDNTPWYKNRSTLAHIFGALVGIAISAKGIAVSDFHLNLPNWASQAGGWILTLAAGMGIYDNHS